MIALLSSVPFEQALIRSALDSSEIIPFSTKKIIKANFNGQPIVLTAGGVGKVNAAHSATLLCEHFPLRCIINLGVGGAYPGSGLNIGQIALANKEIYGDEGVIEPDRWHGMKRIGIPLVENQGKIYFNEFLPHTGLVQEFQTRLKLKGIDVKVGAFITLSTSSGTIQRALELEKKFKAICENMEGAAVAHICALYNIPFVAIRGISNIVEDRNIKKWDLKLASLNCQKAVIEILLAKTPR